MKRFVLALACFVFVLLVARVAAAQQSPASAPKYDPATEVTVKGTVEEIQDFECPVSGGIGAHMMLRVEDKEKGTRVIVVHLAPRKFLDDFGIKVAKGDQWKVIGAKVQMNGQEAILARIIDGSAGIFTFRNPEGRPLW